MSFFYLLLCLGMRAFSFLLIHAVAVCFLQKKKHAPFTQYGLSSAGHITMSRAEVLSMTDTEI